MNLKDWFSIGYGAPEFRQDFHVFVVAVAGEAILQLSSASGFDATAAAKHLVVVGILAFLKSFVTNNQPENPPSVKP